MGQRPRLRDVGGPQYGEETNYLRVFRAQSRRKLEPDPARPNDYLTGQGMGIRGKRFALYAEDGVVKQLHVEAPGEFKVSSAESMLAAIG